jgi:hypothetical protein
MAVHYRNPRHGRSRHRWISGEDVVKSTLVDIEVRIIHLTERAILVTVDDEKEVWLPLSQIEVTKGKQNRAIVTMPEAYALDKELI